MADDEALQALEGRIAALENAMAGKTSRRAADLTDEEIATFIKVRDAMSTDVAEIGGVAGSLRCRLCTVCAVCTVCVVCRVCRVCDVECSCGPCNIGGTLGGVGGFSQFGG